MGQQVSDLPLVDIRAWHGAADGLLGDNPLSAQWFADTVDAGGYQFSVAALPAPPGETFSLLRSRPSVLALRGRGGAAFPLITKIQAVLRESQNRYHSATVIANGAEGEPLSVKDRYLLRFRPHLIVDGALVTAAATGADTVVFYIADAAGRAAITRAVDELTANHDVLPAFKIVESQDTYVAGEETAAVRAVETGVARPTDKPPRPYESGVGGRPTLVSNVETLAWLAQAVKPGAEEAEPRFLATVSGPQVAPRLYELPLGIPFGDLQDAVSNDQDPPASVLAGGFFGGIIPADPALVLTYDSLRGLGSSLGCGAFYLLDATTCPIGVAADVAAYFAANNARQCLSCIYSTQTVASTLASLSSGQVDPDEVMSRLSRWAHSLPATGACAVPDGVAVLLQTLLKFYPHQIGEHARQGCDQCAQAAGGNRWGSLTLTGHSPETSFETATLEGAR
jgi:NADH:ubiquinone oxidoreductase subunit F (NADH-binding)